MKANGNDSDSSGDSRNGGEVRGGSSVGSSTTDDDSQATGASQSDDESVSSAYTSSSSSSGSVSTASDGSSVPLEEDVMDLFDESSAQELTDIEAGRRKSISMRISNKRRQILEEKLAASEEGKVTNFASEDDKDVYSDSSESSLDIDDSDSDSDEEGGKADDESKEEDDEAIIKRKKFTIPKGGVPIETLVDFAKILKNICKHTNVSDNKNSKKQRSPMTTKEVVREIIVPLCGKYKMSFLDLLQDKPKADISLAAYKTKLKKEQKEHRNDPKALSRIKAMYKYLELPKYPYHGGGDAIKPASVFVSHAWNNRLEEVADCIQHFEYTQTKGKFKTTENKCYYWMDIFCVNQWRPLVGSGRCPPRIWFVNHFPNFIKSIAWTLVILLPWNRPVAFSRTWCIYEIVISRQQKLKVSYQFAPDRQKSFLNMLDDKYDRAHGVIDDQTIDVDYSSSRSREAQENIFEACFEKIDHGSMFSVNKVVYDSLHSWSREICLHKLRLKYQAMSRYGEELELLNAGMFTNIVKKSMFCNAFGCVEAFDREEDIRNNKISMLSLGQFMARLYMEEGRLEEAEEMYNRSFKGSEIICGGHSPSSMILMGNIAVIYMKQGRLHEAESMFKTCLNRKQAVLGSTHESTLGTILNLAAFYRDSKRYDESVEMYNVALQSQEEQYGENNEYTMQTVEALASIYLEMGKSDDTLELLNRIFKNKLVQSGLDNPETLAVLENIADMYSCNQKYSKAREAYTKALAAREKLFGRSHPTTLVVYSHLAQLEERLGNFKEARVMYDSMIDGVIKTLGRSHFRLYMIMDKQIHCDIMTGNCTDEQAYRMMYELFCKADTVLSLNDPVTQTIAHHLADTLVKLKRYKEGVLYYRKCYIARKELFGPNESYTLVAQYGLAFCLANSKNFREAHTTFAELLERLDRHPDYGVDHKKTISTVKSYLDVCKISGDKANVELLLRRLHTHYTTHLGHEHPDTLEVINQLAQSYVQ